MSEPVNYRVRDVSAMERELAYALSTLKSMCQAIDKAGKPIEGLNLLELGPGSDFGAQLILASMGCNVTLADRFISRWDDLYHPRFYSRLYEMWDGPKSELESVIRTNGYRTSSLKIVEEAAESLSSVKSESIDFVYSCAVLEHIQDIDLVSKEMFRVMKPQAAAYHQIDLRDHRNFARPLDHLLMSDRKFQACAEAAHFEFGNRVRSIEFWNRFETNGLRVLERSTNDTPTEDYLNTTLPSLRNANSAYRCWPESDLRRTSVYFLLQRLGEEEISAIKEKASDAIELIDALKSASAKSKSARTEFRIVELKPSGIAHGSGFLWTSPLPDVPAGDDDDSSRSELELFEDSFELGPSSCLHADIVAMGAGRFSHWKTDLYFSTSDNSSPLENGRKYTARYPVQHEGGVSQQQKGWGFWKILATGNGARL